MTPVLDVRAARVAFRGGAAVLDGLDLTVAAGEIVGVHGPSGSGKTTLLRVIAGRQRPDTGHVAYGGAPAARPPRGFLMTVVQDPVASLDPRWPAWRSVTEPLTATHRRPAPDRAERRRIAAGRFPDVGLDGLDGESRPGELSGGQCQRLAILRALLAQPRLLLADEPTSALDASVAAGVLRLLHDMARGGTAVVLVSHDTAALGVVADRVLALSGGRLTTAVTRTDGTRTEGARP